MKEMTMRERMLAVLKGHAHDLVPFVQYDGIAASNHEIWSVIGRNNMGVLRWSGVHKFLYPNCRFEYEKFERDGRRGQRTVLYTPKGQLTEERLYEPTYGTSSASKHFIQDKKDYDIFIAFLRDVQVCEDAEHFLTDQKDLGEDGMPMVAVARTPYQQLWVQWVSLMDLSLHLVDYSDILEECISLLKNIERKIFRIVRNVACKTPIPFVNVPDNITAPAIGQQYFKKYCVPLYNELADMLADMDIPVVVHMDGDLKPLWQAVGESRIKGLDSFSPLPDNDTSAAQAVSMWPDKRLLLNFPSSVHLSEPDIIYLKAQQILGEAGDSGRLWIQISENVPPGVWKKSFPQIVQAIKEFGPPKMSMPS